MGHERAQKTHRVEIQFPVLGSQNFIILSLLPETNNPFVGCHSTHLTSHPCPLDKSVNQECVLSPPTTCQYTFFPLLFKGPYSHG